MGTVHRLRPPPAPTDDDTIAVLRWLDGNDRPAIGSAWYQALEQAKAAGLVEGDYVERGHRVTDAGRAWLAAHPTARQIEARATLARVEQAWRDVAREADRLRGELIAIEPIERAAHQAYLDALNSCPPSAGEPTGAA